MRTDGKGEGFYRRDAETQRLKRGIYRNTKEEPAFAFFAFFRGNRSLNIERGETRG